MPPAAVEHLTRLSAYSSMTHALRGPAFFLRRSGLENYFARKQTLLEVREDLQRFGGQAHRIPDLISAMVTSRVSDCAWSWRSSVCFSRIFVCLSAWVSRLSNFAS